MLKLSQLQYDKYIYSNSITFMRYFLILTIILVVMISLCTGLPFEIPGLPFFGQSNETNQTQIGLLRINTDSPDALVKIGAIPSELKSGRSETITFEIQNMNSYDLKNVTVNVYDSCVFTGETSKTINDIKKNVTSKFSWTWKTEKSDIDQNCNIKFKLDYETSNSGGSSYSQDIAVLSDTEYQARETAGTLNQIQIKFSYPNSPFRISLKFSDDQPFLNGENYYMYMDYTNAGKGFLDVKSVTINVPANLNGFSCKDYNGGTTLTSLTLNKVLNFVGNKASTSTCSFTASTSGPISILPLLITTDYKYSIYDSIPIKVKRA